MRWNVHCTLERFKKHFFFFNNCLTLLKSRGALKYRKHLQQHSLAKRHRSALFYFRLFNINNADISQYRIKDIVRMF